MALPTKQASLYGRRARANRAAEQPMALFTIARLPYNGACFVGKAMLWAMPSTGLTQHFAFDQVSQHLAFDQVILVAAVLHILRTLLCTLSASCLAVNMF